MTDPAPSPDATSESTPDADPECTTNADPEVLQTLAYVRRTLEIIGFLLAVLVAQSSGIGFVLGGAAMIALLWNSLT